MRSWILLVGLCLSFLAKASDRDAIRWEIYTGNFVKAKADIKKTLFRRVISPEKKIQLYDELGLIDKLEGDIDQALFHWERANYLRKKTYAANDYHLALNYAFLSNYHYEKMNKDAARLYADSCEKLITKLTIAQQKEIEIHRIWNILAQSYKMQIDWNDSVNYKFYIKKINGLYEKSIEFQKRHIFSQHFLAKTYHLLGNFHLDIGSLYNIRGDKSLSKSYFELADQTYDKSLEIWEKLYGFKHYERAKTLFLKGLLYHYSEKIVTQFEDRCLFYFKESLNAHNIGVNDKRMSEIPNKEDLLMCFKHYTNALILRSKKDKKYLYQARRVNQMAIKCWELIHQEHQTNTINYNLALYSLVPHQETIFIESNLDPDDMDINKIFVANQKLKHYDLTKKIKSKPYHQESINEVQKKLLGDELLLDFHFSEYTSKVLIIKVTRTKVELLEIPLNTRKFVESIISRNYNDFLRASRHLFKQLFPKGINETKKIIICGDGELNYVPFEALLVSSKNLFTGDYRKLDYLVRHCEIEYLMNTSLLNERITNVPLRIAAYAPENKSLQLASLPFSIALTYHLEANYHARTYTRDKANTASFIQNKAPIVHLSSHGLINENPENSALSFSDRLFCISDIQRIQHPPTLLVLNNCNSGKGRILTGDGVDGFVRAFQGIGVKTVLSNLWEVDDKISNEMLSRFYLHLSEQDNSVQALRKSQLEQINEAPNEKLAAPYYWGGHRLLGELLRVEKDEKLSISDFWWILLVIPLVMLPLFIGPSLRNPFSKT